ncbi:MAG: 50S ribosomal protein L35 [Dehalococcoidia bacterium]|nr:50S ribosomal protein L35 [Dehalococcoidia bacterium]
MPKLKTHKGAQARFHITGSGKIMRMKGGSSHLRRNKPKRVKRQYDNRVPVSPVDEKRLRRLMPYAGK